MRRVLILLTSAAVLLGGAVVTTPAAAAATGTLTVTTLGRDGRPVSAAVQLGDRKRFRQYEVLSGRAARVPRGSYLLLADVFNDRDGTDTLAARTITIGSGSTRVTIDARHGRPVHVALSPRAPAGYRQHFLMATCQTDGLAQIDGYTYGNTLYVVPSAAKDVELAYSAIWQPSTGAGKSILVAGRHGAGLPAGVHRVVRQSALATITVSALRGLDIGTASVDLSRDDGDTCSDLVTHVSRSGPLPLSFAALVTPGDWSAQARAHDYFGGAVRVGPGDRRRLTIGRAPWGPAARLPYVIAGRRRLDLDVMQLFAGPAPGGQTADVTYDLRHHGQVLLHRSGLSDGPEISAKLPAAGWYTVTLSGTRHARFGAYSSQILSPRAALRLHVYADPAAAGYVHAFVTRFHPAALDATTRAPGGGMTSVALGLHGGGRSDAVRSVRVWASGDGGRSWHRVAVHRAGGAWTAAVRNPVSGFVSLRSSVLDTHGNSATVTVYRAYGVR